MPRVKVKAKTKQPTHEEFSTGAVRRKVRTSRTDLIPTEGLLALGERYHFGATVRGYGPGNWMKGFPYHNLIQHAMTHLSDLGDQLAGVPVRPECTDSPRQNAAAVAWGMMAIIYFLKYGNPAEPENKLRDDGPDDLI